MTEQTQAIETGLDRVGRERAFDRAREYGWGGMAGAPPPWVWRAIIAELEPAAHGEQAPGKEG